MVKNLLFRLGLTITFFFGIGSVVFYYMLDDFYEDQAFQRIRQNLYLSESMQEYLTNYQKPAVYALIHKLNKDHEYFDPTLLSSTFIWGHVTNIFQRKMSDETKHDTHLKTKFASNNPSNINNKANTFESNILEIFNTTDRKEYKKRITLDGKEYLFYAVPTRKNTKACLHCHGNPENAPKDLLSTYGTKSGFGEKLGHIRAINAIYAPVDANNKMLTFYLIMEVVMGIIFLLAFLVTRYFILQLKQKDAFIVKQSRMAAMGEMLRMIAHQWRQPLAAMSITNNNILLDIELESIEPESLRKNIELVSTQIDYLSTTIDDFGNFFKDDVEYTDIDLNEVVSTSYNVIGTSLQNNGIVIEHSFENNLSIKTRRNELVQVLLNLVKNSMDAYVQNERDKRLINLVTRSVPSGIEIEIQDFAGGIKPEILGKIFEPYFSTKKEKNGTGLGLYMSKMIIEDHLNGTLTVESKNDSTTFVIRLPKRV